MKALIDTIFAPLLGWLNNLQEYILMLSVPVSRPFEVSNYLGPFVLLGPVWMTFITTALFLGFVYVVLYIVMSVTGLSIKFKDLIKWW